MWGLIVSVPDHCLSFYFVNRTLSNAKGINAGVPQGLVLGPLLFQIYINDIADQLTGKVRLYADDTSLSYSSSNLAQIEIILNNDLQKFKENGL